MHEFLSIGWLWLYAGAALMFLELLTPGFVVFFFGLSAATTGLLRFAFGESFDPTWQTVSFSFFSVVYIVLLRRWVKRLFSGESAVSNVDFDHEAVGRAGRVTQAIEPPRTGRVLVGDAEWTAAADSPIAAGADVTVVAQENLTLKVRAL